MPELDEIVLQEYVATANNSEYKEDWEVINSKFPEFKDVDKQLLKEYVATANNSEYNMDWEVINSKFPEFNFKSEVTEEQTLEPGGGVLAYEPEKEQEEVVLDSEVIDFKPEDGVLRLKKDIEEVPDEDRVYEEDIMYIDLKSPITPEIKQTERGNFYLNKDGKNYKLIRTANKDLINFDPMEGRERMEDAEFAAGDFQKDVEEVDKRAQYIEQMSEDEKKPAWEQLGYDSANDYYEYIADQDPGSIEAYKVLAPIGWALDKEARIARSVLSTVKGAQEFSNMVEVNKMAIADHILTSALGSDSQLKGDVLNLIDKTKFIHGGPITAIPKDILESTIEEGSDLIWQRDDSIVDAIGEEGFLSLEVADRIVGGVAESIPSLLLAAAGPGGIALLGASAAGNKFEELVEKKPDEALQTLTFNALGTGITEATFELVTRGIWKRAKGLMGAGDTRAAKALIDSYGKQVLKRLAIDPTAEGLSEAATEFSTSFIDLLTFNEFKDVNFYKWFGDNVKNWADAGIVGFFTGGGITSGGLLSSNKQSVRNAAEYTLTPTSDRKVMMDAAIQINDLNEQLKQSYDKSSRDIIEAKIVQEEAKIINTKNKVSQELRMMNPNELKSYAKNIDEINSLNKKLRKSNPQTVKQAHIDRLSELETENEFYIREAVDRRLDENIKTSGRELEKIGNTVNVYDSKDQYQKAYNNTDIGKKRSMNVTSSDGFIDSDGSVYINKEVAQNVGNVNVAAHELLHAVLRNTFQEPGQLNKVVNEFKATLPRDQARMIQKRIDENYRFENFKSKEDIDTPQEDIKNIQENEDGSVTVELNQDAYNEEYLTAFADLIGNRQISFNENIFTKIGSFLTPIFKGRGYGHIRFDSGKDVYNFIKDYQKQIEKGELKPEIREVAEKGVKGKLMTSKVKSEEKFSTKEEPYSKAFVDKNDKSGKVEIKTESKTKDDITTIKFTQKTTNKKGEPRTQQHKSYNNIDELIEDLDITDPEEIEDIKSIYKNTGGLPKVTQIRTSNKTGKSSASIVLGRVKVNVKIKTKPTRKLEFSKTIDLTKQSNQDKLNDLVGPTNEEGFYTVSKDEFTGSQAETVAKQLVNNGAFDNLIGKKIKVTDPKLKQDIFEDSKEEIKKHIERFNPLKSKNLFGYINSYIQNKVGTAAKTVLRQPKTVSTSKKIGGEDSKVTVAETLVSDEISPEDYTDMKLAQDKLKKIKPQQSKIAKKIDLSDNEINLAKRDIIGFLRKTDRPAMTDPKKFFKALVDYTTGKGVQPGGFAKVIYDKLSLPKDGRLSTKNREAFIREIAEDLIALNKVDPAVMRRSKWTPFYELEIKNMNPKQTQKAIDEGRIPSTTNLNAGNDLFKTLNPSVDQVVDYLMGIRPDVLKRKMPKFLGEVIVKNEFNEIIENPKQPVYDTKGNKTDNTIDLSESVTEEEVVRGVPQVREKIARPEGVKFSLTTKKDLSWKTDEAGNMTTSFKLNNKKYNIELYPVDDEGDYRLNFNLETKDGTTEKITATGNSFKVFSIVYNGVVEEIESNTKIKSFQFEADKSEPTRVKLYTTLMNKLADRLGWESDIYETTVWDGSGSFDFELVKPEVVKGVKFSKTLQNKVKKAKAERAKTITAKKKEGINAEIERQYGGALDKTNPDDFEKFEKDIVDIFADELGVDIFSYTTSQTLAAAGNNAFGSKPGRGAIGAGFFYINEFGGEKKPTVEKTGETASMLEAGFIGEIKVLNKKIQDKYGYKKPKAKDKIYTAKTQTLKNLEYNKENLSLINKEKRNILDKWKKIYDNFPEARPSIKEFQYNNNANAAVSKNEAFILDSMEGATEFNKYEEHGYQHGEYSLDKAKAMSSKAEDAWENWKDYAEKEYKQMVFNKTTKIPSIKGDMRTYQGIVDLTYNLPEYGEWKAQSQKYPLVSEMMDIAIKTGKKSDWAKVPPASDMRFFNEVIKLNPFILKTFFNGKTVTFAEKYGLYIPKKFQKDPNVYELASDLIFEINKTKAGKLTGDSAMNSTKAQKLLNEAIPVLTAKTKVKEKVNVPLVDDAKVMNTRFSKSMTSEDVIDKAINLDKALRNARNPKAPIKKIRVFDFDDTLARTKSNVLYTMPDGTTGKLTAEEFAKKGDEMLAEGAVWDFSEFNKVMDGKKGPLFEVAKKIQEARGTDDVFVLTARAPEASTAIKEFLDAIGLNIPLKNITGLGDSSPYAKSNWIVDKAAEGYNDFYFADDAYKNVKAVRDALEVIDVKSQTQQAKIKFSKSLNEDFNNIIEESTGIDKFKIYSDIKAEIRGAKARRQRFFIPPSAEDFRGLLYTTLPKGVKGEKALEFYKKSLLDPYSKAMENLSTDRINLMNDFKALKKELDVPKDLQKQTESGFTNEQAVRVYLWNKIGEDIPGLSKSDLKELNDIVENNPKLKVFADQILAITKGDGYSTPTRSWATGTITTDLIDVLNTTKRSKYLETWKQNVDIIFSKDNLNKLEAAFGKSYREAVENSLSRMKSGSNRVAGGNKLSNQILDYINNSTAVTMFMNTRSAILQTISAANFINWSFNSPYHAGKAFANQPQYWKDFIKLMNSDYLVDRRNGLKLNINESEIANAAKTSKNKAKAALNYILEKGYLPTKFADSFAIASGGATWYRNKIKDLMKDGLLTEKEAEAQAMKEFRDISEMSQQSSDPSKISSQQSSDLGRIILQYVNTPMQYARLQKRDIQDTVNGRRMPGKTLAQSNRVRASRIAYYMFLQNLAFNALQQGLFAIGFGDDDIDEKEEEKLFDAANGMLDSSLRGLGLAGVTIQVIKNLGIDIYDRSKRKRPEYSDSWIKLLEFSPAIKTKLSKLRSAAWPFDSRKRRAEVFEKGFSLDNPAYESMAKVISATSNVPLDRLYGKINNIKAALSDEAEAWQSLAMVLGWPEWQIMDDEKPKSKSKSSSKGGYKRKTYKKKTYKR